MCEITVGNGSSILEYRSVTSVSGLVGSEKVKGRGKDVVRVGTKGGCVTKTSRRQESQGTYVVRKSSDKKLVL